ncbi:MAG: copper-translocating P-type ATPase [Betaproteobacteria bacterium HGW-Betaproteobacteria-8]|nr:MAG: copper-translocating P-type ATPase [Betaproteobacteria bacterium HGW-Betaproteobacteria-8]
MDADIDTQADCYHCGLPVPSGTRYSSVVLGQQRAMCCHGCQAVADAIVENGLEDYYRYRTELPKNVEDLVPDELRELMLYDHPEVQKSFVSVSQGDSREASLILEGITCAACIWLNERHLKQLKGIQQVAINYSSHRARISWDDSQIKLSDILLEIRKLGYHAHPFSAQQQEALRLKQRKADFRRLAVAGLSAGQVMMIAVALYAGPAQGLEFATAQLLRWFSLVLSVPAIFYAAWPFYQAAWRGVKTGRLGMDVPISLGLITGFAGSIWATYYGVGEVYYDTLTMLIFFLLATRFLERNAREKSIESAENLLRLVPAVASRLNAQQQLEIVPLMELKPGDLIMAKPGETIAADGVVQQGESSADESLLTGESRPLVKTVGSTVYAGSINYESPLTISVTAVGEHTVIAGISRLLDRAQAEKPRLTELADKIAAYFTYALLLAVAMTGWVWMQIEPSRVLEIVLTILVVSCPCALSLAAPAAFAAAGSHLVKRGVLLTRGHSLEMLARVTHVVFDKTGTLTEGRPQLQGTVALASVSEAECLKLAASLEQHSEHPYAKSFSETLPGNKEQLYQLEEASNRPGLGVAGLLNGKQYYLGNLKLNAALQQVPDIPEIAESATLVWLSDEEQYLAAFIMADTLRPQAQELVKALQDKGLVVSILSGDTESTVADYARRLGIFSWQSSASPEQKLELIEQLQQRGEVIAMVGDGINDAPVLAKAQVSIAMGSGTQMARASGDIVLLGEHLLEIDHAIETSRFTRSVVRQNFAWALAYNLLALPFAATGMLAPWMAAIGMSVSSLIVVLNALRLR